MKLRVSVSVVPIFRVLFWGFLFMESLFLVSLSRVLVLCFRLCHSWGWNITFIINNRFTAAIFTSKNSRSSEKILTECTSYELNGIQISKPIRCFQNNLVIQMIQFLLAWHYLILYTILFCTCQSENIICSINIVSNLRMSWKNVLLCYFLW